MGHIDSLNLTHSVVHVLAAVAALIHAELVYIYKGWWPQPTLGLERKVNEVN